MKRLVIVTLLAHWRRQPIQLIALLLGLATATALWSGVQAINDQARTSYDRAAQLIGNSDAPRLVSDGPFDDQLFAQARRAGWPVTPVIEGDWVVNGKRLRLIGIDVFTAPAELSPIGRSDAMNASSFDIRFITPPGLLLGAAQTVAEIGTDILPPFEIIPDIPPGLVYADIGTAQALLGLEGKLTALVATAALPNDKTLPSGLRRIDPVSSADMAALTRSFHLNLTAFGLLSFAVGLFIVRGAIGLAFEQRRTSFRTLRALGVPLRTLIMGLGSELALFALLAGGLGMVLGYFLASALLPNVSATLSGLYGASVSGVLRLSLWWWLSGFGLAFAGTAVAAGMSFWQLAHLPILAPAQPLAWVRATAKSASRQAMAAFLLWMIALIAGIWGQSLEAGFVLLGALLLGAALILPPILRLLLKILSRRAKRPITEWFWADTQQQLPGLSLALVALMLALAANIGVGTMVNSFRATFTGWLDQRLAAELYLRANSPEQAEILARQLPQMVDAVLPIATTETRLNDRPGNIFALRDHATYRDNWPIITAQPGIWDKLAAGEGALINEQYWRGARIELGEFIILPGPDLPVVGVYSDYGNPKFQAITAWAHYQTHIAKGPALNYALRVPAPEVAARRARIIEAFDLDPEQINDQVAIKQLSLQIFERTFTATGALNILTLGVASLALLTALLGLSAMRLPQLAPLWAMGVPRRKLALIELCRAVALSGLTFLVALPLGIILAWTLLAIVNVAAFGWRLPILLFPWQWGFLGLCALSAALVAASWPAWLLWRLSPTQLLQVFSHER